MSVLGARVMVYMAAFKSRYWNVNFARRWPLGFKNKDLALNKCRYYNIMSLSGDIFFIFNIIMSYVMIFVI